MEEIKLWIDYGVMGVLVFMSFLSVGIAVERWISLSRIDPDNFKNRQELEVELTKGLHLIATVGANAPYVGLLGTVLGIMLTFYSLGSEGITSTKEIMTGLALALKATAAGLLVAIPSVIFHNLLLRKVRVKVALWESRHAR